jgi:uncharacterized protein (PEP-CTERM system associated)
VIGREGNDFQSPKRTYSTLYGANVEWRPNERTRLFAEALHQYFGTGHTLSFTYRLPRWAIIASSSRASTRPGYDRSTPLSAQGTAFEVLYLQLAAIEPDPDRRRILVQDLLARNGIDPSAQLVSSLVTTGVLLTENHKVALSWSGVRDTATFGVAGGRSRRIDRLTDLPLGDDFRTTDRVDQLGAEANWIRRVTPLDSLAVSWSWSRSEAELQLQTALTRTLQIQWVRRFGVGSTLDVGFQHLRFDSTTSGYQSNLLRTTWRTQF